MSHHEASAQRGLRRSFDEVRQRNERWLASFVVAMAALFTPISAARIAGGRTAIGVIALAISVAALASYSVAWWQARRRPPTMGESIFRTLFEVSATTAVAGVDVLNRGAEALASAPVIIYALAIFVSVLRLRRGLPLFAAAVAAAEWLALWGLTTAPATRARFSAISTVSTVERIVLLGLCGVLAWRVERSLEALTSRVAETVRERERVRRAFGTYIADPVVERVLSGDLSLETERRHITVLFVDIRGFTTFSAGRPPHELLGRLNQALEAFSAEVNKRGGIVNKFLGDGLMALFGAPMDAPDHARDAAQVALAIARSARRLRDSGAYPELRIGVGLHCGEVVVGDIGGAGHREYTAIGDVVNVASRVEGMTRDLDETVLITAAVRDAIKDGFDLGPAHQVRLRGRDIDIELFGLRGGPSGERDDDAAGDAPPRSLGKPVGVG